MSQTLLQLIGLVLEVRDPVVESQILLSKSLLLFLGSVQFTRDGSSLSQLLLQSALNDGDIFFDTTDVRRTKLSTRACKVIFIISALKARHMNNQQQLITANDSD